MAVLAYGRLGERLSGPASRAARAFGEHERQHEQAIERGIRDLGAHPVPARPDRSYVSTFPPLASGPQALRFALDVENTQISAYGDSLASVVTPELRATLLAILGTEAEHMSVILGELHEPQAARSFVTGNAPT
jgi:hypothetical protein